MSRLRLGISTCPNDTFAFHALLERRVDWLGLEFEVELLDVQELNEGMLAGRFDVAKLSFHAALRLAPELWILPSGSALGFGVGPLLLALGHLRVQHDAEGDEVVDPLDAVPEGRGAASENCAGIARRIAP